MVALPSRQPPRRIATEFLVAALGLTKAEAEIAALLAAGDSAAEVAGKRSVSVETVRAQIKSLYRKVGVSTRVGLAARIRG